MINITEKDFVTILNKIEKSFITMSEVNNLLNTVIDIPNATDSCISLLEKLVNDKFQTISWWVYEKDFGKRKDINIKINNKTIQLNTPEELYDYLIKDIDC